MHLRIRASHRRCGHLSLGLAKVRLTVKDLPVQVRQGHIIRVNHPEMANASTR
jgi:hypothetical protein